MSEETEPDSVEWMRRRWEEHGAPGPTHFAAMASILRTTAVMTDEIDRVLKTFEMTRTAYLVVVTLQMAPESTRPLGQLSKQLLVHPTTITMVIDQLERGGLVRRAPHPSDRRTVLATLTPSGLATAKKASAALGRVDFGLLGIGEATARRITGDLRQVRRGLGDVR